MKSSSIAGMKIKILQSETFKRITSNGLFILAFVLLFFYYGLNETLFYPPQSVHIWRQTNSLSLAHNYYQYNLPFFEPEMHNQFPDDGQSGKSVGEFPIIYFVVAQLWKIFGKHEWIFKLVQTGILFLGLFALFHAAKKILKNIFWAGFISLLVFTSPMVIYYGPNFLPDGPALAFVFMAWYFIVRFYENRKTSHLWIAAILFCLANLLKITSAISMVAFGGWVIWEQVFMKKEQRIFNFALKQFIPFILFIIPVISWYLYVDHYNQVHRGHFSFHGIWPIWNMTSEQYHRIIDILDKIYFKELFFPATQYLTLIIWIFLLANFKKLYPLSRFFIVVLPIGFVMQLVLWFQVLEGHDYYLINLLVVLVAVWVVFASWVEKYSFKVKRAVYFLAIVFFILNAVKCSKQAHNRYLGWMNDDFNNNLKSLLEIEPSFREWGIGKEDKVISINDYSINGSLYYMNRKGYTHFGSNLTDKNVIYQRIEQGAKYMVVTDTVILSEKYLEPFIQSELGSYKNVVVFDLQGINKPE
jgi:hypothetical protein